MNRGGREKPHRATRSSRNRQADQAVGSFPGHSPERKSGFSEPVTTTCAQPGVPAVGANRTGKPQHAGIELGDEITKVDCDVSGAPIRSRSET
jgi:hypothetical protein